MNTTLPADKFSFFIRDDVYLAGYTVDGEAYTAERYSVIAEAADGSRLRHHTIFLGCETGDDDIGEPYFADVRAYAKDRAQNLIDRILERGQIDRRYWSEIEPCYGSDAYVSGGYEAQELFRERMEDGFGDNILARVC